MCGETGAGKTTLINSYLNTLLGVEFYDPFRFKMIFERGLESSSCGSITSSFTIYHIPSSWIKQARFNTNEAPYCINIIDTPGFADTRGLNQDFLCNFMLKEVLNQLDTIDNILLVVSSNS